MKKILGVLAFVGLMSICGTASAYIETLPINQQLLGRSTYTWHHTTPGDFEVPYDMVYGATLDIFTFGAVTDNDVAVEGEWIGTLNSGTGSWDFKGPGHDDHYNITDIFATWTNGNTVDVTITTDRGWLYIGNSVFMLDYANGYPPISQDQPGDNVPNPEPATMLLLGSGLAGIGLWGKRRKITHA